MDYHRLIEKELNNWKTKSNRKPLIIRGARQVGKTTLVKNFSSSYKQFILLNLEKSEHKNHFEKYDDVKKITASIFLSHKMSSDYQNTLLFIDEVQESPKAIQLLRYFYEEIPELHVITAGSLLEFALGEVKNFPVGRVEYLYLFPLNFQEFLKASGNEILLGELNQIPVREVAHQSLLNEFHDYAIIGGMPEIIKTYLTQKTLLNLPAVYESIWTTYKNDVEKYAKNDTDKKVIRHIINTAPNHLDKRVKFQNFGNSNYRSREVGEAFRSLDDSKVIQLIYPTTSCELPIQTDFKKSPRLQFLDTGIVNHVLGIQSELIGLNDLSKEYKGAVIPHLITQELMSLNAISYHKPNFWVREKLQSSAEVDLIVQFENRVIPIEIKSGSTGSLKSLHQFIEQSNHPYAIRIYGGDLKVEQHSTQTGKIFLLMNIPYYLGTKIFDYLTWCVKNHKLITN